MKNSVYEAQVSLRAQYMETPELAMVTDEARTCGIDPSDPFHSQVKPMLGGDATVPFGVHRAVGGPYDAPCPGDLLCAALAACQDSSVRMVANLMGIELLALEVQVKATVDVRGAMGIQTDVPVGFQSITCDIHLKAHVRSKIKQCVESLHVRRGVASEECIWSNGLDELRDRTGVRLRGVVGVGWGR